MALGPLWWPDRMRASLELQLSLPKSLPLCFTVLCELANCDLALNSTRHKQRRPLRRCADRQRDDSDSVETCSGQQSCCLLLAESEPHVAHLLAVLLAIVREHVRNHQPAALLQYSRGLAQCGARIRKMMQHENQGCGIELPVGNRQRLQFPSTDFRGGKVTQSASCRLEHLSRSIDGNDTADKRSERTRDLTGSATKVADDPLVVHQRREHLQV